MPLNCVNSIKFNSRYLRRAFHIRFAAVHTDRPGVGVLVSVSDRGEGDMVVTVSHTFIAESLHMMWPNTTFHAGIELPHLNLCQTPREGTTILRPYRFEYARKFCLLTVL